MPAAPNIANGNTNRIRIKNHQAAQGKAEEAEIEAQPEEEEEKEEEVEAKAEASWAAEGERWKSRKTFYSAMFTESFANWTFSANRKWTRGTRSGAGGGKREARSIETLPNSRVAQYLVELI